MKVQPNKQPCSVCKNRKAKKPFRIRDDEGYDRYFSHICNCPYCGRFLVEDYEDSGEGKSDD